MSEKSKKRKKIALITGSARRLGKAVALKLHAENLDIVVHCNHSYNDAEALVKQLNSLREDSATVFKFDLRDFSNYKNIISGLGPRWSNIDVLINNASTFYPTPIEKSDFEQWDDLHDVNLKSPFFLSKSFYKTLKDNSGCIVNIVDIYSDNPLEGFPIYSVAKAGLKMLTKSLSVELGPSIRVNGVSPGSIMWPEVKEYENKHQEIIESTQLKRQGDVADIADTCYFLINNANYITGQIINVDGGRNLSR